MNNKPYYSMPPQKLLESEKTEKWGEECVDAILSMSSSHSNNGRTSKQNKQINYDLYNSIFDEDDFNYVLDPYGSGKAWGETPVKMQNYNIFRDKIEVLKGEEIKRPFNFFARGIAGEVINVKQNKKRDLILQYMSNLLLQELGEQTDEEGNVMTPAEIQKYMDTKHMDPREVTANQLLNYLTRSEEVEMKFNQGWEHALVGGEEIYYVGIVSGEPKLRVVNPLNFDYDMDDDLKFIEDAQWVKEERWMTPGTVLDEFGEYMSEEAITDLDYGRLGQGFNNYGMQHSFAYSPDSFTNFKRPENGVYVATVMWKSMKKIGFLKYIDPKTNQVVETVVDDSFQMTKTMQSLGAVVEWRWINEIWEGTKIGKYYVNIRPLPNQTRTMSNPSECKMPYTGYVYNSTNSTARSIVDLVKPHQYTYMIVWWRLESELAKAKGKKFVFDISQLPKSQGWTMDQWLYYFDNLGIAVINTLEEGKTRQGLQQSNFNQYSSVDLSLSQAVGQYIEILNKLEQQVEALTGVNQQRAGQTSASETATGVQQAVYASSHITEPYFYYHNIVKKQVLVKLLETAKLAYAEGKQISYIVDEVYTTLLQVDPEMFPDSDYGVFVSNSSKDHQIKEKMEALAQVALQQDKVFLSDIISIYESNSISEMKMKIVKGENDKFERDSQAQQQQMEAQQAAEQEKLAWEREKMANENTQNQLDRENEIQKATLSAMKGKDGPGDMNANGIPDPVETARLYMEESANRAKISTEQQKLGLQAQKQQAELAKLQHSARMDEEKLFNERQKLQLEAQKLKSEIAMFQREQDQQDKLNAQQAKLKLAEHQMKMKEMDKKMALEKYKIKNKPKPAAKAAPKKK